MIHWALQRHGMVSLAAAHVVILLVGVVAGVMLAEGQITGRPVSPYWQEVHSILTTNAGALFALVAVGVVTVGIGGLTFLYVNGFMFGDMLGKVLGTPTSIYVLWYAPLEFAAFLVAGCSVCRASFVGLFWLQQPCVGPSLLKREASLLMLSLGLVVVALVVSAMLEAVAIMEAWRNA